MRFGAPPRSPRSMNVVTGKPLEGVSCYEGWLEPEDEEYAAEFVIDTEGLDDTGIGTLVALCAMDRPAVFVEGEQVGEGPEGEPLVAIDRWWPVPRDTDLTSNEVHAQSALELWSRGPRDGSGVRLTQWRLGNHEAGYLPANMAPISLTGRRRIAHATQGKGADKKKKGKAAKVARKKNRK